MSVKVSYNDGLEAAATQLDQVREDFKKIIDRMYGSSLNRSNLIPSERVTIKVLEEKCALLNGQAMHIRAMKR